MASRPVPASLRLSLQLAVSALCLLASTNAQAQAVELAPFAGIQFGGSVRSAFGPNAPFGADLDYGGTLDVRITPSWRVEVLYSRQQTSLRGPDGPFDAGVERVMAGVVQEQGDGPTRFFGVALIGATRFVPGVAAYGSEARFTIGVGLGIRHLLTRHLGVRAEARGFWVSTETGSGLFCRGECLFVFGGSGLGQADLSAGLVLAF